MKRLFDILASLAGLLALGWLIGLLVILVRRDSHGPGIFAQVRVGRHGQPFTCYKLRTMRQGTANVATHEMSSSAVTSLGESLRRYKLDELPQLWNVLRGDMSFVGPRPCLPVQREVIEEREKRGVLALRPGITGLAQVNDIDMSTPVRLAEVDAEYLATRSFVGDLVLILRTVTGSGQGDRVR
ncbi:lipid carrier : UDP-N-acetylgalactosaminyltransferase [Aureimonas ureilytica]|uniref:Lipid carrier: UDP-N-acetylgalactosaminyltransferase n=1 Tax=Aureimonas ureilytica TaxID=401562 RepID=A0A175RJI5_9HYPH|nr:sugar transferase [Aureimonas ureilytica]KTQ97754.1 lipid carrier : UDP-N-acetylgalactosaminyltransferase [Aureimonas ureilytica]KTR03568.1 lipid carrier : UDP-N-acetylgalactosaminyltransferase [Aureimonas ureilytica]